VNATDVGGREPYADLGRFPGPTLLEKLPLDVLRDDTEFVRVCEDTEDESDVLRAAPTRDVPFTTGRDVGAAIDLGSPALSANVLRFGSGSPSVKY
jgi:hypothetical protein